MYRYLVVLFDDWSIMMMKSELNQVSQKCAYHLECVLLAGRLMIHQIWWLCITGSPNIENRNFRTILAVIHFISNDKRCQIFFPFDRFILKKSWLILLPSQNQIEFFSDFSNTLCGQNLIIDCHLVWFLSLVFFGFLKKFFSGWNFAEKKQWWWHNDNDNAFWMTPWI